MKLCFQSNRERGIGRILVAVLMLVLWLGTATLAASPDLHHRLHKESKSATHECLVTLLSKSQLLAGGGSSLLFALVPIFFGLLLAVEFVQFASFDYRLSPSRAPPLTPAPRTVVG